MTTMDASSDNACLGWIWGLVRVLRSEHNAVEWKCLDVSNNTSSTQIAEAIVDQVCFMDENEVRLDGQVKAVPHLETAQKHGVINLEHWMGPDALHSSYLITGGTGALGLRVARCLIAGGAKSVC